ncbi:hypothetical protein [Nitrosomonas sp.]|uniref:hypothetical protein n=1 Tax=Nitrosomonas sp. TaxID=42353 RepID=UPI0025FBC1FD|nr:hypothetical protein [Nitrosomonas sp.]
MNETTQLSEIRKTGTAIGMQPDLKVDFFSKNGFELACEIAKALSTSDAVPSAFRQFNEKKGSNGNSTLVGNPASLGNCLVAIEVAKSVGLSMISVMQNADVIQGKLRWSSKFQIAAVNACGRFTPLQFKLTNLGRITAKYKEKQDWNKTLNRFNFKDQQIEIDNWECVAWAYVLDANRRPTKDIVQSIPVSMKMAVEEGWYAKDGSKWQGEMRFQMLQYRAGTFFASIYAQDAIMGMGKSSEEINDVIDVFEQADGSFSANNVNLQDLKSSPDAGDLSGGSERTKERTETADKKPDDQKQNEQARPGIKTEESQAGNSDSPSPEEKEKIRQREIAESSSDKDFNLD